jgi:epoxyqueuosine reductase QueG
MKVDRSIKLQDHLTVRTLKARNGVGPYNTEPVDADWLREVALECGADDVGFVALDNPAVAGERDYVREALPGAESLVAICLRSNRENMRSVARSVASHELYAVRDHVDLITRAIARRLEDLGVRAVSPPMDVPMEATRYPDRMWIVSQKTVAVAAGLGRMGIHSNVIHPRFGTFIGLGTVIVQPRLTSYSEPLAANPCIDCQLCVDVCPVGAIKPDGRFEAHACATHNNHESYTGFISWVKQIADSRNGADYARRFTDPETSAIWQTLAYKPTVRCAYCVAVCPAGEDVIGLYEHDRETHLDRTARRYRAKAEYVYVTPGSPAEDHVQRNFPVKRPRHVPYSTARPDPEAQEKRPLPAPDPEGGE